MFWPVPVTREAAAACVLALLRIMLPTRDLAGLWGTSQELASALEQYCVRPCLQHAVRFYVKGILAKVSGTAVISVGTMCSGTDYVMEVFQCVCKEFRRSFGTDCNVTLDHVFSVESNPKLQAWCKTQANELGFDPKLYSDMNKLEVERMNFCDILIAGTSCKSLSSLNTKQRSLADVNPEDALCSSGNTMNGPLVQTYNILWFVSMYLCWPSKELLIVNKQRSDRTT